MTDIVERLRKGDPCGDCKRDRCACVIMEDAADEIERLRAALRKIASVSIGQSDRQAWAFCQATARAALADLLADLEEE